MFGGVSGAHFNPAVTSGFLVTGRISASMALGYVASQLLGSTTAAGFCRLIFPAEAVSATHLGLPLPAAWASTTAVDERGGWHWAYWVAPIAGACVAALVYEHLILE